MLAYRKIDWRSRTNAGFIERFMGVHESQEKILVSSCYRDAATVGRSYCVVTGVCSCSIYIYSVLISQSVRHMGTVYIACEQCCVVRCAWFWVINEW